MDSGSSGCASSVSLIKVNGGGVFHLILLAISIQA